MSDNVKAGVSIYHASTTKIIVFTVCAAFLIGILRRTILSIADCDNTRNAAINAYSAYNDLRRK